MTKNIQYPWLFSNLELSFPFMPPVYPSYLAAIFTDAYIIDGTNLRTDYAPIDKPLRLVQFELTNATTAGLMQLQYVDDGSLFFFDNSSPTTQYRVWDFGDWKVVAADNHEERKFVRLTLYTPNIPAYPFKLSLFVDGLEAVFAARVHEQNLPKIYSIKVTDAETGIVHILDGDVEIRPGYNVEFSVGNDKVTSETYDNSQYRLLTPVTMNATPGSGLGRRKSDCDNSSTDNEVLRLINFQQPDDNGNMKFALDKTLRCGLSYSGTGTVIIRDDAELSLDNDGSACCTCEDYGDAYKQVLALQQRAMKIVDGLVNIKNEHCRIIDVMNGEAAKREIPEYDLLLIPRNPWIVTVLFIFRNNGKVTRNVPPIIIKFTSEACDYTPCWLDLDYKYLEHSAYVYNQHIDTVWRPVNIASPEMPGITNEVMPGGTFCALCYEILFINEEKREAGQKVIGESTCPAPWGDKTAETELRGFEYDFTPPEE